VWGGSILQPRLSLPARSYVPGSCISDSCFPPQVFRRLLVSLPVQASYHRGIYILTSPRRGTLADFPGHWLTPAFFKIRRATLFLTPPQLVGSVETLSLSTQTSVLAWKHFGYSTPDQLPTLATIVEMRLGHTDLRGKTKVSNISANEALQSELVHQRQTSTPRNLMVAALQECRVTRILQWQQHFHTEWPHSQRLGNNGISYSTIKLNRKRTYLAKA